MTRIFIHYILVAGQSGQARQLVSSLTNYKVEQSLFFHLRGLYYYYQDNLRINPGLSLLQRWLTSYRGPKKVDSVHLDISFL